MSLEAEMRLRRGNLELAAVLHVNSQEILALLGPNGAGKTTLLRALAGLTRLEGGRVELDGQLLEDPGEAVWMTPEQRRVGVVFQDHVLFPHLSVLENIAFGLRSRGVDRSAARRRAQAWLEPFELGPLGGARPRALSGGQAQRVALARALITEPRLLLLDEPLASVDPSARVELRRALRAHLTAFQGVRILVTHDPVEAAALADWVVILEAGHVVQQGTFPEVTARPRSPWAARMAGLNLLRGDVFQGRLRLPNGAELAVVSDVQGLALATIHPRAIALHRDWPSGSPRNVLRGTVAGLDHEGDRWRIRLDGPIPIVAEVTPPAVSALKLADGGEVFAAIKATEIEVYSA